MKIVTGGPEPDVAARVLFGSRGGREAPASVLPPVPVVDELHDEEHGMARLQKTRVGMAAEACGGAFEKRSG